MNQCPFCNLTEESIVARRGHAVAILDQYPVTEGHSLVIPTKHVGTLFDLSDSEMMEIFELVSELRSTMYDADQSIRGFNIGLNEGEVAGQTIPHCHIHLIPRREGDMEDPRGGVRHVIPSKGNYLSSSTE